MFSWGRRKKPAATTTAPAPLLKVWGRTAGGAPFTVGLTISALIAMLQEQNPDAEVCMVIEPWHGVLGKAKRVEVGVRSGPDNPGQVWIAGYVLDESLVR